MLDSGIVDDIRSLKETMKEMDLREGTSDEQRQSDGGRFKLRAGGGKDISSTCAPCLLGKHCNAEQLQPRGNFVSLPYL